MIVPGLFVCSNFLISVCMFIVSKALLTMWLNLSATVLFSVSSTVTVQCCMLYPCYMGVFAVM